MLFGTLKVDISDANLDTKTKKVTITKDGNIVTDYTVEQSDKNEETAFIELAGADKQTHKYVVTVECTDEAGNPASLTKTIIIDKTAPCVTIDFKAVNGNGLDVSETTNYTSVGITFTLSEEDSYSEDGFKTAVEAVFENVENLKFPEVANNADGTHSIFVKLENDGIYKLNGFEYEDKCGNKVVVDNSDQLKTSFTIDNTAPKGEIGIWLNKNEKASEAAKKDALVGTEGRFKLSNITDKTAGIVSNELGA